MCICWKLTSKNFKKRYIKEKDYSDLYESFFIPNLINAELLKNKNGSNKKKFLKEFGHLRPLTYSINTKIIRKILENILVI